MNALRDQVSTPEWFGNIDLAWSSGINPTWKSLTATNRGWLGDALAPPRYQAPFAQDTDDDISAANLR